MTICLSSIADQQALLVNGPWPSELRYFVGGQPTSLSKLVEASGGRLRFRGPNDARQLRAGEQVHGAYVYSECDSDEDAQILAQLAELGWVEKEES